MDVNDRIRAAGCNLYTLDPHSLRSLEGNSSAIYMGRRDDRAYVIKFVPLPAWQFKAYEEKMRFLSYLADNGASVTQPLPSKAGLLLERLEDDGQEYAVLLTAFANGIKPNAFRTPNEWNEGFFMRWGKAAGRLHALARSYPTWNKPPAELDEASTASQTQFTTEIETWQGMHKRFSSLCQDAQVLKAWQALAVRLECLPQTREIFGLTHNDMRHHNVYYNPRGAPGKEITILDFGASAYNWFLNDIASSLYHAMTETMDLQPESLLAFAKRFMPAFMQGYNQEYELDRNWSLLLPLFLQCNQVLGYIILSGRWSARKAMPWQTKYLARIRRLITSQALMLPELAFESLG